MPESNPAQPRKATPGPAILTLDVGSSSVRTLLYDAQGREVPGFGLHIPYELDKTLGGGIEVDADFLCGLCIECLSAIHQHMDIAGIWPTAVAVCTFWHNVLGLDGSGSPTTPVIHPFDTRSADAARALAKKLDPAGVHARTGCVLHASYLPAKLAWLAETQPQTMRKSRWWMSFGEYLFFKLFGRHAASTSMVSGSGLWNQNQNTYDPETLRALPAQPEQFAPESEMDKPVDTLVAAYRTQWPEFSNIPWFPALGDGACNNIGSGACHRNQLALMVGTSGALRSVVEADRMETPGGLWVYRLDRKRFVVGGALTDGGAVYAWMKRLLNLPGDEEVETALQAMPPLSHGLTVLPLFAGERSPGWRGDARAALIGLGSETSSIQILRASLEAVALRFRLIYDILKHSLGAPQQIIASGGALLYSPAWTQMMADALACPVTPCLENEATSRGAALVALERLGAIPSVAAAPPPLGDPSEPNPVSVLRYEQALELQSSLYVKLFGDS
ncbi:MAG TPA: gluconokinase [Terriglobia bacterium]|nr:gluconokinase [Terriglobia bacterium]